MKSPGHPHSKRCSPPRNFVELNSSKKSAFLLESLCSCVCGLYFSAGKTRLPKQQQWRRRPLLVSGTILVLSAIVAVTGLLIKRKAEKAGNVQVRPNIASRLVRALEDRGIEQSTMLDIAAALDPAAVMEVAQIVRGTHPSVVYGVRMDSFKWRRKKLRDASRGVLVTAAGMAGFVYGVWRIVSGVASGLLRRVLDLTKTSRGVTRLLKALEARPQPVQPEKLILFFLVD